MDTPPEIETVIGELSDGSDSVDEILVNVTEPLSVLSSCDSGKVCQVPAMTQVGSPGPRGRSSQVIMNDRRVSYKRRSSFTWTLVSPTTEDGHEWRKYGQKEILNAKYPRCYYRCTYRNFKNCPATKQVQRMEEDSNMYQITYRDQHRCKDLLVCPQIISNTHPHCQKKSQRKRHKAEYRRWIQLSGQI